MRNEAVKKITHVKIKKNLGIGVWIAAAIFLFEPNINLVDIFPDVLGYVLLCNAISRIASLNDSVDDALGKFKKMILVSALKPLSIMLIYGVFAEHERPTSVLLFTFCFSLAELLLLIPAYNTLFNGLLSLASRRGVGDDFGKKGFVALGERAQRFTTVFVVVKVLCSTLPELTVLCNDIYTESIIMYLYNFINHFRVIGVMVSLVFGMIWLVRNCKFIRSLVKNDALMSSLTESFSEVVRIREGLFIQKNLSAGVFVFVIAAVLCVDLHVPDFNYIPDVLAAAMLALGAFLFRKYLIRYKKTVILSAVYFIFSAVASYIRVSYLEEYGFFTAANHDEGAYVYFIWMCVSTIFENILFVSTVFSAIFLLRELVMKHTGVEIEGVEQKRLPSTARQLFKKLWITGGLSVLAAIWSIIYDFMLIERGYFTDITWAVDFAASVLFAASFIFSVMAIWDEIKIRYMYS